MAEWIAKYWIQAAFTGLLTATGIMFAWAKKKFKRAHKEYLGMRTGTLALLHDRLYQACTHYLLQGHIDVGGLDNIIELYRGYNAMGGNGTGTELYNKVLTLPIKED